MRCRQGTLDPIGGDFSSLNTPAPLKPSYLKRFAQAVALSIPLAEQVYWLKRRISRSRHGPAGERAAAAGNPGSNLVPEDIRVSIKKIIHLDDIIAFEWHKKNPITGRIYNFDIPYFKSNTNLIFTQNRLKAATLGSSA